MTIDLVGPARRGLAMGLNEAAGYLAAQYGLRPAPLFLGLAFVALGLGLSATVLQAHQPATRDSAATPTTTPEDE